MSFVNDTPLLKIKSQVLTFYQRFSAIADYLEKASQANPADEELKKLLIRKEDFLLQFYIDKTSLEKINHLMSSSVNNHILVLFGLHEHTENGVQKEKPTACFLAMGDNNSISIIHKPKGEQTKSALEEIPGQQTWPPPPYPDGSGVSSMQASNSFSLASTKEDLEAFFN